jgi:hypothetical protein
MWNCETVLEWEDHNFESVSLETGSDKFHQWRINLEGNLDE